MSAWSADESTEMRMTDSAIPSFLKWADQVSRLNLARSDSLDLQRLRKRDTPGAIDPVIDLSLADRRRELQTERRLSDPVFLQVVAQLHNHIMVYFKTWWQDA